MTPDEMRKHIRTQQEIIRNYRDECADKQQEIDRLNDELYLLNVQYAAFREHAGPLARAWAWVRGVR